MKSIVFNTKIRGAGLFGALGRSELLTLANGAALILQREPDNPVDTNAIIVMSFYGVECGYVARQCAAKIAPLIDAGLAPYAHVRRTPFIQVRFDIEEITSKIERKASRPVRSGELLDA